MTFPRSIATFAALLLVAFASPVHATGSLSFEGGGYWIDLEVGQVDVPVIAAVRFHHAGDSRGVLLPMEGVVVEMFDPAHRVLELRFKGAGSGSAVEPFTLSASGNHAVLRTGTRRIVSAFDWSM